MPSVSHSAAPIVEWRLEDPRAMCQMSFVLTSTWVGDACSESAFTRIARILTDNSAIAVTHVTPNRSAYHLSCAPSSKTEDHTRVVVKEDLCRMATADEALRLESSKDADRQSRSRTAWVALWPSLLRRDSTTRNGLAPPRAVSYDVRILIGELLAIPFLFPQDQATVHGFVLLLE